MASYAQGIAAVEQGQGCSASAGAGHGFSRPGMIFRHRFFHVRGGREHWKRTFGGIRLQYPGAGLRPLRALLGTVRPLNIGMRW